MTDTTTINTTSHRLDSPDNRPWRKVYDAMGIVDHIDMPADNTSLIDCFERNFTRHGDKEAYVCMGASLSFRELDIYSQQMAAYLQSLGLKKGDKVAVMLPNILQYPICMLAVIRAGLVLVNVNPLYTSHELNHQLADSDARAIILLENFAKTYQNVSNKGNIEHVIVTTMGDMLGMIKGFIVNTVVRHVKKMVPNWHIAGHISFKDALKTVPASQYKRPNDLTLDDLAVLQYTGGTTGVAKGAMLSHRNLVANLLQCLTFVETIFSDGEDTQGQYILVALPLYHIFSFTVCGLLAMDKGFAGVLVPNPRDLDSLVKDIDKYRPAFFPAVNTLFNGLAHHAKFRELNLTNIRVSLGGGMSVMSNTANEWKKLTGTPILEGYGLSETSPVLTMNPPTLTQYTGKIGIPAPATDIILVDDDGNEVAIGEAGEIAAKGPQIMQGYWKRPEDTADCTTKDGYFRTGDIGVMDNDGYFKIVDRKKDMILVSGFNVYPNEVEDVMTNHPKIMEAGVIGVPDDNSGEVPKIYIVRKDSTLSKNEVIKHAKEHLTGYKRPRHVEFVDELPKSPVGKILRKELRKLEEKNNNG